MVDRPVAPGRDVRPQAPASLDSTRGGASRSLEAGLWRPVLCGLSTETGARNRPTRVLATTDVERHDPRRRAAKVTARRGVEHDADTCFAEDRAKQFARCGGEAIHASTIACKAFQRSRRRRGLVIRRKSTYAPTRTWSSTGARSTARTCSAVIGGVHTRVIRESEPVASIGMDTGVR